MKPIAYRVTKHTIPRWVPLHEKEPRGIAYETATHFVHLFGKDRGLWTVSIGLTATEAKSGTLREWVDQTFGAQDIVELEHAPGHATRGVWRPGLYFDEEVLLALGATAHELRLAEQTLLLLIHRLDELLHFVEPTATSLSTYSHKSRELLILACTEVENCWASFLRLAGLPRPRRGFTTNEYVKLLAPLRLIEFAVSLPRYAAIPRMLPFYGWSSANPTATLPWYDAYNKTKHDRTSHFDAASLENCILAVMANIVLFAIRFGPFRLFNGAGTLPAFVNELFSIDLDNCDPKSFYVPILSLPTDQRRDLICYGARDNVQPWVADPLVL
jgi:hypothetical protein